jgi:hypothetical protein
LRAPDLGPVGQRELPWASVHSEATVGPGPQLWNVPAQPMKVSTKRNYQ